MAKSAAKKLQKMNRLKKEIMNLRNLKFQKLTMQQAQKIQGGCLAGEVLLNMAKWDKEIKEKRALDSLIRR